jgi:hypothetical protein
MIAAVIASVSSAVGPHAVSFFLTAALVGSRSAFMNRDLWYTAPVITSDRQREGLCSRFSQRTMCCMTRLTSF